MVIKELRLAFVQTESIPGPLAALNAPAIPYRFLLNEALFQAELASALAGASALGLPWDRRVGKRFWYYYLERTLPLSRTPKQMWRRLVPLRASLEGVTVSGARIPATVETHAYVYPWGVGLAADVVAEGSWSLEEAVKVALNVRKGNVFDWTAGAKTARMSLGGLLDRAIAEVRSRAYGGAVGAGQRGEVFSIVTVTDAEGVDAGVAVESKTEVHRALEAWTGWSSLWKSIALTDLKECTIDIMRKESLDGHVLYGGRRGRAVWFPAKFRSGYQEKPDALKCYHQNLFVSTLQTESLCRLSQAVADQLKEGQTVGQFPVTYRNCMELAAGILGRLWGGPQFHDSYRSQSLRDQIKRTYFDAVNIVRASARTPMPPLS